jgi:hypothetical protein
MDASIGLGSEINTSRAHGIASSGMQLATGSSPPKIRWSIGRSAIFARAVSAGGDFSPKLLYAPAIPRRRWLALLWQHRPNL